MKKIQLSNGKFFTVPNKDYKKLSAYHWCLNQRLGPVCQIYAKQLLRPNAKNIIFKNRNVLDLSRRNLIISQTPINPKRPNSKNTSGCVGVVWNKRKQRWTAVVHFKKKCHYLGAFTNKKDAFMTYKKKYSEFYPRASRTGS